MRLRQILPWQKPRISNSSSKTALSSTTTIRSTPNSNTPTPSNSNSNNSDTPPPQIIITPPPIVSPVLCVPIKTTSTGSNESGLSILSSTALCPTSPRHKSKRPVKIQSPHKRRSATTMTTATNKMNPLLLDTSNSDLATIAFSTSATYNNIPDHVIINEDNNNKSMEYRRHHRNNKKHVKKKEEEEKVQEADDDQEEERMYMSDEEMAVHLQMEWNQEDYMNEQKQYKQDKLKAYEIQRMEHDILLIQQSPGPIISDAETSLVDQIEQKKKQQQMMAPPPSLPQQQHESLSSLSSSFLELVRTTNSATTTIPKNIIQEQEQLLNHYKVDHDKAYEMQQKEELELKLYEENEMKSTSSGYAILLCNKVTEVLDEMKLKYPQFFNNTNNQNQKIISFVTDDMLHFAEQLINTYQQYQNLNYNYNELYIDISYHYTSKSNINTIKTFGLLNAAERELYQINPIRSTGLVFGDGIYTSNNPFIFHKKYGSIGLMIATIKGKVIHYKNRVQLEELNHTNITNGNIKTYNTLRGNKKKFTVKPKPQPQSQQPDQQPQQAQQQPPRLLVRSNSCDDVDNNTNDITKRRRKRTTTTATNSTTTTTTTTTNNINQQQQNNIIHKKSDTNNINDYYDYLYEEDVIQTSMQCLPLISYDSSIIQSLILLNNNIDDNISYDNNLGNCCIIELQEKLQNVLNHIFFCNNNTNNDNMKCPPPVLEPNPAVSDLSSFSSSMKLSTDWNNNNHHNAIARLQTTSTKYIPLSVIEAVPSYLLSSIPSLSSIDNMSCHSYDDITDDDTIPIIEVACKIMIHQEKMEQMLIYTKPRNNKHHNFVETKAGRNSSSGDYKTDMDNDLLLSNIEYNSRLNNHRWSSVT